MLAFIYLAVAVYLGDRLCRRFYRFVSTPHRWAAAVLVGLLVSTWFTYLAALVFAHTARPLLWADLSFFAAAIGVIFLLIRRSRRQAGPRPVFIEPRAPGSETWDWTMLAMYFALAGWMMFTTFGYKDGKLLISGLVWNDFAAHTALIQSFAVGHNFPPEYPFFANAPIRYHFLFFFQAGNLEYLGLNIAWSLNILSAVTMVCMLALVMSLGQLLFNSRTVGRIGSALFFFHGSLAFIPFFRSQPSVTQALRVIFRSIEFLHSGYPYRGETWGIWTQSVFVNQRHLAAAIGVFLLVLVFLIDRYQQKMPQGQAELARTDGDFAGREVHDAAALIESEPPKVSRVIMFAKDAIVSGKGFIFSGLLLGALPFWNALVFTSAFGVLLFFLFLFPYRKYMVVLGFAAAAVALPQVWYLSLGAGPRNYSLFQWGYTIENPTIAKVVEYLGFTFGLKWPVIILALLLVSWFQRRFFIAICSLLLLTFLFRFSVETPANHKFLNIWLILANLFVAYGLCWLWKLKTAPILGPVVATALTASIVASGVIDLFPFYNGHHSEIAYENDPLVKWVLSETKADKAFLSDRFLFHPILLAGRRIFYGYTLFAWGAGYDLAKRESICQQMFESKDPRKVFRLLRDNNIGYVAFDNGVRHSQFVKRPNEQVYAKYFSKVFEDKQNRYNSLTIYKVPDTAPPQFSTLPEITTNMFEGGKGTGSGQFDEPLGIAVDRSGNVLVADSRNGRLEKFAPSGTFITSIGIKGTGYGQFREPNGIAIDRDGNIYVADAANNRVQKLAPDGNVIGEWTGPPPGFYAPRDIAIGPDNSIYILDQGHSRIVRMAPDGTVLAVWGSEGASDGQFANHTGLAVDGKTNRVYVADPLHKRIQVFDSNGKFLWKWIVEEWQNNAWAFQHLVIDPKRSRLYASSVATNSVLVFDLNGTKIGALRPKPPDKLDGPSAMALWGDKLYVLCTFADRVSQIDLVGKE
jgi:DNA-binding beta-propeller fold protein YncE